MLSLTFHVPVHWCTTSPATQHALPVAAKAACFACPDYFLIAIITLLNSQGRQLRPSYGIWQGSSRILYLILHVCEAAQLGTEQSYIIR